MAPHFILGAPRSGTSLLFDLVTKHSNLLSLKNTDDLLRNTRFFGIFASFDPIERGFRSQYHKKNDFSNLIPRKSEVFRFLTDTLGEEFTRGYKFNVAPTVIESNRFQRATYQVSDFRGRAHSKLIYKITGPAKIKFLEHIFPESRFVFIRRARERQVASLAKTFFWQQGYGKGLWWKYDLPDFADMKTAEYFRQSAPHPISHELARTEFELDLIEKDFEDQCLRATSVTKVLTVSYEDLINDPVEVVSTVWNHFELDVRQCDIRLIEKYKVHGR